MNINTIKDWAEDDQPRNKLLIKGIATLSDAELMAILLGTGTKGESALSVAKKILKASKNLDELGKKDVDFFTSFRGVGKAKAVILKTALEIGRRRQIASIPKKPKVTSSEKAYELIGPLLSDLRHEEFWILGLNRANMLIHKTKISSGGWHGTVVDPKVVFAEALKNYASGIILGHNHPSGNLKPSTQDIQITKKLAEAGKLLEITIHDHIIVGQEGYFSFRDEGYL